MKYGFIIAVTAFIACVSPVSRASELGDSALKCFAMAYLCEEGKPCTDEANQIQVKCFEAIGFSKSGCTFKRGYLSCEPGFVKKIFTNVNGCQVYIIGKFPKKYVDAYVTPDSKSSTECRFGSYLVEDNPYQRVTIVDARKTKSGWTLEIPKMSVGFESILPPNNVKIQSVSTTPRPEYTTPPWIYLIETDFESPSYKCEAMLENLKSATSGATPEISNNRMKIFGYDDVTEPVGKKHFGGDGGRYTSVVAAFSNLKEFQLCGRAIPVDTKMWYSDFSFATCLAATPGAVSLALPASLFREAKGVPKELKKDDYVYCEPKALKASNFHTLIKESNGGKKPIIIPKLDWQNCDCEYVDPNERSRW